MLNLSRDEKNILIKEVQNFFYTEREEEIGIIAAENILDFFIGNLGNRIYNKALDDSRKWFEEKIENIGIDYNMLYKRID